MKILLVVKEVIAYERTAISSLSAVLKAEGHEVRALIVNPPPVLPTFRTIMDRIGKLGTTPTTSQIRSNGLPEAVSEVVREFRPHVIGYTMMTGEHQALLELNRKLKQKFDFYTVLGGPHAQFSQQIIEEEGVDAICIGEGDTSFPEFIKRLDAGKDFWLTETFHVKHEGKIYRNPLGPLIPDLDVLPDPDRQILYDASPSLLALGARVFFTQRGCPYHCSYCFNEKYNKNYSGLGKIMRTRSPERAIKEMEAVKERFPVDYFHIQDDVFTIKPRGWIQEFCKLYKQKINLPFAAAVRLDNLREEDVKSLSEAGLSFVWVGVETGNEAVAKEVFQRGGHLDNETIIAGCKLFQKYGVNILALNIMGAPVENPFEVDMETVDLNLKIKPAFASCGLLYPFPGTPVEEYAIKTGYMREEQKGEYLESSKRHSMFKFNSEKEKKQVENLQKLAGLVIDFPFLRPLLPFLTRLPLERFYYILFILHVGYCYKVRMAPVKNLTLEAQFWLGTLLSLLRKT